MTKSVPATPYFVVQHPNGWTIQTKPTGAGECVAQQYADATLETAQFIVTACNGHQRLIDSLKLAKLGIEASLEQHRSRTIESSGDDDDGLTSAGKDSIWLANVLALDNINATLASVGLWVSQLPRREVNPRQQNKDKP